ncbi:ABC transporter protein [Halomicronema hongdechloris C2206]|uniref:Spermidine/putrescine import ATP-binding protein PotA n=1 Tax=Halomicronema hongdechloris C2206 TaxID=1641165 RepID=A0A1Z3HGJ1_9CYAN|nr:ABC transporter ATP-binding protein [Halomicronema hongdechloris]ASC69401.1 ABC transporter protein [Halomicronema hongdechloris C2206]
MAQTSLPPSAIAQAEAALDVELRQVSKSFDGEPAVRAANLAIHQGEFFSILGPSGCGKTTVLRMIAGFEVPSAGEIIIRGRPMGRVPAYRRPVNMVFQNYALFDHLSVWDNVAFGLRLQRVGRAQLAQRVQQALHLVKMENFAQRFPSYLSGGQQQRVALARALVNRPAVMLLDEPLGALDLKLRKQMQVELSNLQRTLGITFIMVTHDQEEALSLSDRIAVMQAGRIEQVGSPSEIYEYPKTPFVADFIGETNLLSGQIQQHQGTHLRVLTQQGLRVLVQHPPTSVPLPAMGAAVFLSVRPENIHLSPSPPDTDHNCYPGQVSHVMYLGTHVHCIVQLTNGAQLMALQPNRSGRWLRPQTPVYVRWSPADCLVLGT